MPTWSQSGVTVRPLSLRRGTTMMSLERYGRVVTTGERCRSSSQVVAVDVRLAQREPQLLVHVVGGFSRRSRGQVDPGATESACVVEHRLRQLGPDALP